MSQAHSRFVEVRRKLEAYQPKPGLPAYFYEFLLFGFKQAWACLFGGLLLFLLLVTHLFYPEDAALHRYDFLTISAVLIQVLLLLFKRSLPAGLQA